MQTKLSRHSFWLSALLHLLLFLLLIKLISMPSTQQEQQRTPNQYVPAYTYTGSIKPSLSRPASQPKQTTQPQERKPQETKYQETKTQSPPENTHERNAIPLQKSSQQTSLAHQLPSSSLLADSFNMLKQDQLRDVSKGRDAEPIYLIGNDNAPSDPLVKLMGRSLSAHFAYPRTAGELGIRGKVIIELTLHPEGYYSDVQILRSSNSQDLDAAALYAVNSAPKVIGADRFISKPRHFIVGFVFY
jgi:TonB family protein